MERLHASIARLGACALAGVSLLALIACDSTQEPQQTPVVNNDLLVFWVQDGDESVLVSTAPDGSIVDRVPFEHPFPSTAGKHIVFATEAGASVMLPDGSERREIYRAPEGKSVDPGPASPDGTMVALFESDSQYVRDVVVIVRLRDGQELQRYERTTPELDAFLGHFYNVSWHGDGSGVTIDSGGVQVDGGFRQSFAALRFDGSSRVTVTDASSAASPDGRLLAESLPAEPGCMGFVSTHSLRILDLLSGEELASIHDTERGLRIAGWFPEMSGPVFVSLRDAGCHPAEEGDTLWELPEDGAPPAKLDFDPWQRQEEALAARYQVELSCGDQARHPLVLTPGSGSGCSGFGGPMPMPGETPTPTPTGADRGELFVGGRPVAHTQQFTFVGTVSR